MNNNTYSRFSEQEIWSALRTAFEEQIQTAVSLRDQYMAMVDLGNTCGYSLRARQTVIAKIISEPVPVNPTDFLLQIERLRVVTSFPGVEGGYALFDKFLDGYAHRAHRLYSELIERALVSAQAALAAAKKAEHELFESNGLKVQPTEISAGAKRVVQHLTVKKEQLARLTGPHDIRNMRTYVFDLGELFHNAQRATVESLKSAAVNETAPLSSPVHQQSDVVNEPDFAPRSTVEPVEKVEVNETASLSSPVHQQSDVVNEPMFGIPESDEYSDPNLEAQIVQGSGSPATQ